MILGTATLPVFIYGIIKKFLASTYCTVYPIWGGGPRPDTDKIKFRGTDLKVPGIPLLKMLPDPPLPLPLPLPLTLPLPPYPSSCSKEN